VNKDIPAFMLASGSPCRIRSINSKGMQRRGFSPASISSIQRAFKSVFKESQGKLLDTKLDELQIKEKDSDEVKTFIKCIRSSKEGIMRGPSEE